MRRANDIGLVDCCWTDCGMAGRKDHERLRVWSAGGHPAGNGGRDRWRMDSASPRLLQLGRIYLFHPGSDAGRGGAGVAGAQAEEVSEKLAHLGVKLAVGTKPAIAPAI